MLYREIIISLYNIDIFLVDRRTNSDYNRCLFCDLPKKKKKKKKTRNTLGGQNVEFLHVEAGGIFSNRRAQKG